MSQAGVIDSLQFARERGKKTGSLELASLPRLAESGCTAATLSYVLQGGESPEQRDTLHLKIDGQMRLQCQRCLGPLDYPVASSAELELASTQGQIDDADDDKDRVLASKQMDVATLVEDEAILALPMIPMHEQCIEIAKAEKTPEASPFAALAALKKGSPH